MSTKKKPGPVDLTGGSRWEFRMLSELGPPGEWLPDLADLANSLLRNLEKLPWPRTWQVYDCPETDNREMDCPREFRAPGPLPMAISIRGASLKGQTLEADDRGMLDLTRCLGDRPHPRAAFVVADVDIPREGLLTLHAGADWWMQWWMDGVPLGHTFPMGNRHLPGLRSHEYTCRIHPGPHRLVARVLAGSLGWVLVSEGTLETGASPSSEPFALEARRVFTVDAPGDYASLTLVDGGADPAKLNGRALIPEQEGMRYRDWEGIDPGLLRTGDNVLRHVWESEQALGGLRAGLLKGFTHTGRHDALNLEPALLGIPPEAALLGTGPLLGWADHTTVTLSCRANARVPLCLRLGGRTLRSEPALIHRFAVSDLEPGRAWPYTVETAEGRVLGEGTARTLPIDRPVTLGILGDPSPSPERFELIAARLHALKPDVLLLLGDLTRDGRMAPLWDGDLFHRAPDLFRNTPTLAIQGNHEMDSPYLEHILVTPSGTRNWVQRIATLTLIGIDGAGDWSPGSANHAWLDKALETRETPFVVVANHYPAFSSSGHGVENGEGIPREPVVRSSRFHILPLLARHRVQAYFNGHEHGYERSLLPGGVTALICAGGGGRLYPLSPDPAQNPHRLVNQPVHHIGLLTLTPGEMIFEARGLNGFCLDRVLWRVT